MKCDNDIFDPNFQSKLDDFFKSFSIETRRGGWFRYFNRDEARSMLSLKRSIKTERYESVEKRKD